ncbi:hypothetical protein ACG83_27245 [Frankia sp. R43]|uniref:DUF5615 family PIN-like protein n=1 Tax=Frankia sp. R43 TaxID=269536 RepID=UPI0006C9E7AC|nr:DUF5615 family PIN-like protein [Frankia sp. R43]KPM53084.1 hypothetical protein ACG83_27245 [Frankia sp. R43]
MKLLLDENVPRPMADIVRILLRTHQVIHVHDLPGWAGTKDIELYEKARVEGFEAVLTNDTKQMSRGLEVAAIAASGLHRIEYRQNNKHGGLIGLGAAIATVCAGLPHALAELLVADGQRLISLVSVDPTRATRVRTVDPRVDKPKFWPSG